MNFIDTADVYNGGPLGGDRRARHRAPTATRWVLATKVANPTGAGPERPRPVAAPLSMRPAEAQPAPARHGRDRHLLPAQGGPRDAARRDRAGDGRPRPGRQDPLFRRLELPRLAGRRDLPPVRRGRASTGRSSASPITTRSTACPRSSTCRPARYYGLGVVPYRPLARGVLTGKYDPDAPPPEGTRAGRPGQAHDGDRMARRKRCDIAQELARACRGARHHGRRSSRSPGC